MMIRKESQPNIFKVQSARQEIQQMMTQLYTATHAKNVRISSLLRTSLSFIYNFIMEIQISNDNHCLLYHTILKDSIGIDSILLNLWKSMNAYSFFFKNTGFPTMRLK